MEVSKLDKEELQYELKIRGFAGVDDETQMKGLLRGLLKSGDSYSQYYVVLDAKTEIDTCIRKIRELKELVDSISGSKLDESYRKADTKLCHLLGRIDRITTSDEKLLKSRSVLLKTILYLMTEMESKVKTFPDPLKETCSNVFPVTRTLTVTKNIMPNTSNGNSHSHSHVKNGDDPGVDIFSHQGVALRKIGRERQSSDQSGTLSITQYKTGKCIEWKATEVSFETENTDAEWDVVDAVRRRTCSTSSNVENCQLSPTIRIPLKNLRSYKIKNQHRQISFRESNNANYSFQFQAEDCSQFVACLRSCLSTKRATRSNNVYNVIAEKHYHKSPNMTNKSFNEVNIIPGNRDQKETYLWSFVKNIHSRPYETTLQTFSKLTDVILFKAPEQRPIDEEVVELLAKSFHVDFDSNDRTPESDFTIIEAKKISLNPRRCSQRENPLNIQRWTSYLDSEGRISNPEAVKYVIFKGGIEPQLRQKVWKYLLNFYPWHYTSEQCDELYKSKTSEYYVMKKQWQTITPRQEERFSGFRERKNLIEKDVNRTDRTMPFYSGENNPNLTLLSDILMTYVMYNFDIGYVQGMSDLLSPILYLMKNEVDAFWCFAGFMDRVYNNFELDQSRMKKQLSKVYLILKLISPDLASRLQEKESDNMYFCFRWLLVLFKREFVMEDIMTLWEVLWTDLPCPNFHILLSVSILEMEKHELMKPDYGFSEILKYVNELSMRMKLDEIITQAEGIYYQLKEADDQIPLDIRRLFGLAEPEKNESDNDDEETVTSFKPETVSSMKSSDDSDSLAEDMERVTFTSETGEIGFEGIEKAMAMNYY